MERTITPQPRRDRERAILAAVERLLAKQPDHPAYGSKWRRLGAVRTDLYATARPRRSRGATRA